MNCKSHFNIIKLPGSVPGQGLEIQVITVSLELAQALHTCGAQIRRWSEPLSGNDSASLSLQEPTMHRLEVSPTQLKLCICISWQDFSFPLWSSLAGHRDCNTKTLSREQDEIRNFFCYGLKYFMNMRNSGLIHMPQSQ